MSLLSQLLGTAKESAREATMHQSAGGDLAIRQGPWKLIFHKGGQRELYNLENDLSETNDVIAANDGVTAKLTALMQSWIDQGRSTAGAAQKNDYPLTIQSRAGQGKGKRKGEKSQTRPEKNT